MPTAELVRRVGTAAAPLLFDVRRRAVFEADERLAAGARWRPHDGATRWGGTLPAEAEIVVYCAHGHALSQAAAAQLRAAGRRARYLEGGFEAYLAAGGTTVLRAARPACDEAPSHWVTRERPKVDRLACPWLVRRFVDPAAVIHYVAADQVLAVAGELGAVAFDIDGAPFTHDGERCSFDAFLDRFGLDDPALARLATIVRGADTGRPELAPEAAGLLAASLGISATAADDGAALAAGMALYDALLGWLRHAAAERHNWPAPATAA